MRVEGASGLQQRRRSITTMSRPVPRRPLNPARRPTPSGIRRPQSSSAGPGAIARHAVPGAKGGDDTYLYVAGIRDPSNRMVEYRVGLPPIAQLIADRSRCVPSMQDWQAVQQDAPSTGVAVLSQDVRLDCRHKLTPGASRVSTGCSLVVPSHVRNAEQSCVNTTLRIRRSRTSR